MNRYRLQNAPQWWPPKLRPALIRVLEPFRRRERIRKQRLTEVRVSGIDHLRAAAAQGAGILITPNHSSHADPDAMYEASRQTNLPFYFMAAWQVFDLQHALGRWFLQTHGVFSVDREGVDVQAFKQALAESGYGGGNEAVLVLDKDVLGKVVYRLNKAEGTRIGVNLSEVQG